MDGRGYLEKLIADRSRASRHKTGESSVARDLPEIRGVALGLVAAGALHPDDMARIIHDLERSLSSTGAFTRLDLKVAGESVPAPVVESC